VTRNADPPRFVDPAADAPAELRELFRGGERDLPSSAELDSLAQRLSPLFASPPAPALSTTSVKLSKGATLLAIVSGLAVAGLLAYVALNRPSRANRPPVPARVSPQHSAAVAAPAPGELEPSAAPLGNVQASPAVDSRPNRGRAPSVSSGERDSKPSEAALLEQARHALRSDPARALSLTEQHQLRFPNGALKQEREVIAIEALRRLGRSDQSSERARLFQNQYPDSAHRRAVETGLSK
jgi:hypothetical protein